MHRGLSTRAQPVDEVAGADALLLDLRVAHEVDRRHDDDVGAGETLRELVEQEARAAVLVRLEDADESFRTFGRAEGAERRVDLRRMVAVVIEDDDLAAIDTAGTESLHPAFESVEGVHRRCGLFPVGPAGVREDDGGGGVERVVFAGECVGPLREPHAVTQDADTAHGAVGDDLVVGARREAEGLDRALEPAGDAPSVRTIVCDEKSPAVFGGRDELRELGEGVDDGVQRAVDVEVIFLDVVDEADLRSVPVEGAIELAGFDDEEAGRFAEHTAGDAVRAGAGAATDLRAVRADDEARVESAGDEHVAEHRGRRALAVRAGDRDAGALTLHAPDRLGVTKDFDATVPGSHDLGVVRADGGGGHDEVDVGGNLSLVAEGDLDAGFGEAGGDVGRFAVGSGTAGAEGLEHERESADAASARADEPDRAVGERRGCRLSGGRHSAWASVRISIGTMAAIRREPGRGGSAGRVAPYNRGLMTDLHAQVLIVDDEVDHAEVMAEALRRIGHVCTLVSSLPAAEEELRHGQFDVIVTDLAMDGETDGLTVLSLTRELQPGAESIMVTAHGDVPTAKRALQEGGAYDFIEKPLDLDVFRKCVNRAAETVLLRDRNASLRGQLDAAYGFEGIIGESPGIRQVIATIKQVAPARIPVLVTGESGTGKELVAAALHKHSPRADRRFVALNAAGQSESLIEDELFGHVRGAYTGAERDREGVFQYADGGTLFLDEIGDMPLTMQAKLLRVLETGEVVRLGANESRKVDVRFISATHHDLRQLVGEDRFREDLFFRIRGAEITLPALRERREDIPLLVKHFLGHAAAELGRGIPEITEAALMRLVAYRWPGNVRELRNAVDRLIVMCPEGEAIDLRHVPDEIRADDDGDDGVTLGSLAGIGLDRLEKEAVRQTLAMTGGNREQAAKLLGLGERTLYRKLKEYGIK